MKDYNDKITEREGQTMYDTLNSGDENENNNQPKKQKNWKAFKIILAVIYAIITLLCIWTVIDACGKTGNGRELGIALTIVILIGVYSLVGYVPLTIAGLVGVVKAVKAYKSKECSIGTLVYFIVFTLLPLITYGMMLLIFPRLV